MSRLRGLFNGTLRYVATDRLSFALSAYGEHNNDRGAYPWVPSRQQVEQQPWQIYSNYSNTEQRRNLSSSFKATYRLPGVTLSSVTALQHYDGQFADRFDFDFTGQDLISGTTFNVQRNFTQELRASSNPSSTRRLSWTVGTFAFRQHTPEGLRNGFYLQTDSLLLPANEQGLLTTGSSLNRGIAGFGQVTYQLTDRLSVTGGLRYDYETRELVNGSAFTLGGGPATVTQADTTFHATSGHVTQSHFQLPGQRQRAGLRQLRSGFPGRGPEHDRTHAGRNPLPARAQRQLRAGVKTTLLNQRARVNVALFYLQQRDQQIATTTNGLNNAILNVGKMNNFGAELEAAAVPVKGLELSWNAAYNYARYAALPLYNYTENRPQQYAGNQPINTPVVSSMLTAQYTYALGQGKQQPAVFVRGEWRYLGQYYFDYYNQDKQTGYALFNARAGVSSRH